MCEWCKEFFGWKIIALTLTHICDISILSSGGKLTLFISMADFVIDRKRKSNFDVGPESVAAPSAITTFLTLNATGSVNHTAMAEVERLRAQFGLVGGSGVTGISSNNIYGGGFDVVTDPAFTARIEKALEKNFDYILR